MVWDNENGGTSVSTGDLQFGGFRLSYYAIVLPLTCCGAHTATANTSNYAQKRQVDWCRTHRKTSLREQHLTTCLLRYQNKNFWNA